MVTVIQRVREAKVEVSGEILGQIGRGILALVAVEREDGEAQAEKLARKLLGYRIFADREGKMNFSVTEVGGELLLVPQFTLAAETKKGMRPSFTPAAPPEQGARLFNCLIERLREAYDPEKIATGRFGADMLVSLVNEGPVTFILKA